MSRNEFVPQESRALISRTTILILASLLIWVGAGRELPRRQNALYLLLGSFGMAAYLGLERAAYRRLHREYSTTKALYRLEQRLHAQQEQWIEVLGLQQSTLQEFAFPGLAHGAARVAENGNGRARVALVAKRARSAQILRMPEARAEKSASGDTFLNTATTRASLA